MSSLLNSLNSQIQFQRIFKIKSFWKPIGKFPDSRKSFPWKHFWKFAWVTQWKQNLYGTKQKKIVYNYSLHTNDFFSSWFKLVYQYKIRHKISKMVLCCRGIQNFERRFFKLISWPIIPQHTIHTLYLYSES